MRKLPFIASGILFLVMTIQLITSGRLELVRAVDALQLFACGVLFGVTLVGGLNTNKDNGYSILPAGLRDR